MRREMGESFKSEGMYFGWFILRFDRKQQNSVKQLSFNLKINNFKKYILLSCNMS